MTVAPAQFRPDPPSSGRRPSWRTGPSRSLGEYCNDLSIMLGSLSIVMFWTFGFGILLGVGAVAAGIVANRHPAVEGNEPKALEALLGTLAGAFGIAAGLVFLAAALPQL